MKSVPIVVPMIAASFTAISVDPEKPMMLSRSSTPVIREGINSIQPAIWKYLGKR